MSSLTKPQNEREQIMSQTIRWGVIGTARIATRVGAAIRSADGAELRAIASRTDDKAAAWAEEHGASRHYGSYQAVLDDPEIDAVYIPLPPSMHREWTVKAAEQGKHVLCEKPLAATTSDAIEMADACRQHNVQLMDGVMWLHHPRAADMLSRVRDGSLGTLRRITSAFSFNWDTPPEGNLRLQRELGGGALLDLGWYCVGASLWALDAMPERVLATARFYNDVDMNTSCWMWFPNERIATFDCGFDTVFRRWFEVAGTQHSLVCDDFTRPWIDDKVRCWIHDPDGRATEIRSAALIQEVCMIEDFCEIIRGGELDAHWPDIAVKTQRICEALDRSARTGEIVEL